MVDLYQTILIITLNKKETIKLAKVKTTDIIYGLVEIHFKNKDADN